MRTGEDLEMCECWIRKIDGKWRVAKEAVSPQQRRIQAGSWVSFQDFSKS